MSCASCFLMPTPFTVSPDVAQQGVEAHILRLIYRGKHLKGISYWRQMGGKKSKTRVGYICAYPPYESAWRFPPRAHFSGRVPRSIALIWPLELARFACHAAYGVNYNAHADAAAPALVSITTKRGGDTGRTTFTKKKLTARLGPGGWEYIE